MLKKLLSWTPSFSVHSTSSAPHSSPRDILFLSGLVPWFPLITYLFLLLLASPFSIMHFISFPPSLNAFLCHLPPQSHLFFSIPLLYRPSPKQLLFSIPLTLLFFLEDSNSILGHWRNLPFLCACVNTISGIRHHTTITTTTTTTRVLVTVCMYVLIHISGHDVSD